MALAAGVLYPGGHQIARDEPKRVVVGSGWPGGDGRLEAAVSTESLYEYADGNAERLYALSPLSLASAPVVAQEQKRERGFNHPRCRATRP
jgi:hypothetical protein